MGTTLSEAGTVENQLVPVNQLSSPEPLSQVTVAAEASEAIANATSKVAIVSVKRMIDPHFKSCSPKSSGTWNGLPVYHIDIDARGLAVQPYRYTKRILLNIHRLEQ